MAAWTWFKGEWLEGNPMIFGPMTHATWLGSCVFDGARSFNGFSPDLDQHCLRVHNSALAFGLAPFKTPEEIEALARQGIARFKEKTALYIRPMFWAEEGFVDVEPDSTQFCISVYEAPMPGPQGKLNVICSKFRRPSLEYAPTDAKAACHYPNSARAMREAKARGYHNAIMLDPLGNVSELATANVFHVKDGEVHTPVPNGTFLNGITRQRIIRLLRSDGIIVHERSIRLEEMLQADEVFTTGNWAKVVPITRIEETDFQPGPLARRARELYWAYARGETG